MMKYEVLNKISVLDFEEFATNEEEETAYIAHSDEIETILQANGYSYYNTLYNLHFFGDWRETTENGEIYDSIEALAIKEGVDVVKFENGHLGIVAYYNDKKDFFEILGDYVEEENEQ